MSSNTSTAAVPTKHSKQSEEAWNILGGIGLNYTLGGIGGSFYHFFKAAFSNPNTNVQGHRFINCIRSVRLNTLPTAASVAFWVGGVYTASVYSMEFLRQKEDDSLNEILGAAATGMMYKMRRGFGPAVRMGVTSVVIWYVTDTAFNMMDKATDRMKQKRAAEEARSY